MKITLRPYAHDKTRWHVDIRLMNPCNSAREIRKRLVAPARLSEQQARAWGERQVPRILQKVLGTESGIEVSSARKESAKKTARSRAVTLGEFYVQRFVPEHVQLQKPATQNCYSGIFRNHLGPLLGDVPLVELDEDRVMSFRAVLHRRVKASSANLVLAKLRVMLRFAKRVRVIAVMPDVESLPMPRKRPKPVYSDEQSCLSGPLGDSAWRRMSSACWRSTWGCGSRRSARSSGPTSISMPARLPCSTTRTGDRRRRPKGSSARLR